jgi:hypothetical protein
VYKGQLFIPHSDATFQLIQPYETKVKYIGYATGKHFTDEYMVEIGLKLVQSLGNPYTPYGSSSPVGHGAIESIFELPVGSKFKTKYKRGWHPITKRYGRIIILCFTNKLNKNGPIKGNIEIHAPTTPLMVEQLS